MLAGISAVICTGRNIGAGSSRNLPRRTRARQFHNKPRLTSYRRATSAKDAPGCSTSPTIRKVVSGLAPAFASLTCGPDHFMPGA
jgi:hypothetical protein